MPLLNIKPCSSVPKIKICDNQNIFDIYNLCKSVIICGQKRVGGKEMLKASGGKVKCLGKGEKS